MNKNLIILFFLICSNVRVLAQHENVHIRDLNGIWHNLMDSAQYNIFKNGRTITFFYAKYSSITHEEINPPFIMQPINTYCFISKTDTAWEHCKDKGNSLNDYLLWGSAYKFYLDGSLELESTNVFFYKRIDSLPYYLYKELYNQSQKDKRDYLKEFLDMDFREITVMKAIINSSPSVPSKQYVIRGDVIQIIDRKDQWLKIRYYGSKTIEGWIKKTDVE